VIFHKPASRNTAEINRAAVQLAADLQPFLFSNGTKTSLETAMP
jgi:hypothetical protein